MTKPSKAKQIDMTRGNILPAIFAFAIPLMLGSFFQQLYSMVDGLVVGNYVGSAALAAVGTGEAPLFAMACLFIGLGTGITILTSQAKGRGDNVEIKNILATCTSFGTVIAIPLSIAGIAATPLILRAINVPEDVFPLAYTYIAILLLGAAPSIGYNLNAGVLRGLGDSRNPLMFLVVAGITNIVLDLVFVIFFRWGVVGVAAATFIAQAAAWLTSVVFIRRHYPALELKLFSLKLEWPLLRRIFRVGLPLGLNNFVYAIGGVILQSMINTHGSVFMAGVTAANRMQDVAGIVASSFAAAGSAFCAQNVGAMDEGRIKKGVWVTMSAAVLLCIALSSLVLLLGKPLISMFNDDPDVINYGYGILKLILPFYWIFPIFSVMCHYMNGAGEVKAPTLFSMVMFWGIRLPLAWYLSEKVGYTYIYLAYPISWVFGVIMAGGYFLSGRWKRHYMNRA